MLLKNKVKVLVAATMVALTGPVVSAPSAQAEVWHWQSIEFYGSLDECYADGFDHSGYHDYSSRCWKRTPAGPISFQILTNY